MTRLLAMLCATALLSAPAFGQSAPEAGAPPDAAGAAPAGAEIAEPSMAASQDRVISVLESAGYPDVRIVDTTYAVKARTPEGETVTIVVDLATMPGVADPTAASEGAAGSASVDAARFGSSETGGEAGSADTDEAEPAGN